MVKDGQKVNTLEGGDFFGEIALVHHAPRTATVNATSPVRTLVITERNFKRLLDELAGDPAQGDASRSPSGWRRLRSELGSEALGQRGDDLLAQRGRVLVGERALARLEADGERDRLAARADLVAPVDVEGAHLAQLGPRRLVGGCDEIAGRDLLGHREGEVLPDRRGT